MSNREQSWATVSNREQSWVTVSSWFFKRRLAYHIPFSVLIARFRIEHSLGFGFTVTWRWIAKFIGFWLKGKKQGCSYGPKILVYDCARILIFLNTHISRTRSPKQPTSKVGYTDHLEPRHWEIEPKNLHCFAFFYKKRRAHPMHTRRWHSRAKCRRWHTSRHTSCKRFPGWSVERRQRPSGKGKGKKDKRRQERSKEGESWQVKSWTVKVPQEHAQGQKRR